MTRARRLNCESAPVQKLPVVPATLSMSQWGAASCVITGTPRATEWQPPTTCFRGCGLGARVMENEIDSVPFGSSEPDTPKRRNFFGETFSGRPLSMLNSAAFRVLTFAEHKMLLRIEIEAGSHAGHDNSKWPVTYDQFEEYGIRRQLISPSRRALVALGFITFKRGLGAKEADKRRPNLFGLTYRHTDSKPPVNTWRKIADIAEAKRVADEARNTLDDDGGQRRRRSGRPIMPLAA